ncbi:MAG: ABC transporter ATP-binding protein, partial [Desulfocapsaceae bacterium]
QTVALVGESGSGKSLTALSILRLLEEHSPIKISGTIRFEKEDLLQLPLDSVRQIRGNRIAMIFQEPMTSLNPVYTVGNQIAESLKLHRKLRKDEVVNESIKLLERTGIEDPDQRLSSYPHQLSGGQRQRVMIAMALACRPALLIADEPTTALDVTIQAKILNLIKDIQHEYEMAMLLITHDLALVSRYADYIYILQQGTVMEHGSPDQIFNNPRHNYTLRLIQAIPGRTRKTKAEGPVHIMADGLNCSFRSSSGLLSQFFGTADNDVQVLDDVSLSIRQGTTCGIIGESGSGKTTLALALLKLQNSTGAILFNNRRLDQATKKEIKQLRDRMQIVFQDPYSSLSPRMTVDDIVSEGLVVHKKNLNKRQRALLVSESLEAVGLPPEAAQRYPHEFSGGQRQRIAIARVLILRPELLILDEPTSALDVTIQAQIIELLNRLQQEYQMTYLFISHDLKVIRAVADELIVMQDGRIIERGPASELFSNPRSNYTRQLFQAAL